MKVRVITFLLALVIVIPLFSSNSNAITDSASYDGKWHYSGLVWEREQVRQGEFIVPGPNPTDYYRNIPQWHYNEWNSINNNEFNRVLCDDANGQTYRRWIWYAKVRNDNPLIFQTNDLDDEVSIHIYDINGKLYQEHKQSISHTDGWQNFKTFNFPQENDFSYVSDWYKFVVTYRDTGGDTGRCRIRLRDDPQTNFEFIDSNGDNIPNFRQESTSQISPGLQTRSFFIGNQDVTTISFEQPTYDGFIVSCERYPPQYTVTQNAGKISRVDFKSIYNQRDAQQCHAIFWSQEFETQSLSLDFLPIPTRGPASTTPVTNSGFQTEFGMASCNSDRTSWQYADDKLLVFRLDRNDDGQGCGVVQAQEFQYNFDQGKLYFEKVTLEGKNQDDYQKNPQTIGFTGAERLDGAVVRCSEEETLIGGPGNNKPLTRYYVVNDETVNSYPEVHIYGKENVRCTIVAWELNEAFDPNTPVQAGECPNTYSCSAADEGNICIRNGNYNACVYSEDSDSYQYLELYGENGGNNRYANSAFKVPHDVNIGEGRNDIVSDYKRFYQCSEVGNNILPPPSTESCTEFMSDFFLRNIRICDEQNTINCCDNNAPIDYSSLSTCINSCNIEDSQNLGQSLSSQEVREIIQGYGVNLTQSSTNDGLISCDINDPECGNTDSEFSYSETCQVGVIGDVEIKECTQGCAYESIITFTNLPLNTESQTYCCIADYGNEPCGQVPSCPSNNWIEYSGLQECSGEVQEINGEYCCLGEIQTINLPNSYTPVACNIIGDEAVGYSCENYDSSLAVDLSVLDWGMSTGKISKQLQTEFKTLLYTGASAGIEEKIFYLDEDYLFRKDWTTAEYLEFDFKIIESEDRKFSFSPTNFYLKINGNDFAIANASNYLIGDINEVYRVRIPLNPPSNIGLDYSNVQSIGVGTKDKFFPNEVYFALDNIKLIDEENTPFLCGYKGFVIDPDVYDENNLAEKLASRYACEVPGDHPLKQINPLSWTGTQCCGDDITFNTVEAYNAQRTYYKQFDEFGDWTISDIPFNTQPYIRTEYGASYAVIEDDGYLTSPKIPVSFASIPGALNLTLVAGSTSLTSGNGLFLHISYFSGNNEVAQKNNIFIQSLAGIATQEVHLISISDLIRLEVDAGVYDQIDSVVLTIESADSSYGYTSSDEYRIHYLYFTEAILDTSALITQFEYYADSNSACFMGKKIVDSRIVGNVVGNDEYDNLLYENENFYLCDFYETRINPYEDIFLTDEYGNPTSTPLVDSSYTGMCQSIGTATCTGDGWSSYPITFDLEEERQGFSIGTTVYCGEDGLLYEPEIKFDWYLNDSKGCFANSCYCPFEECGETNNGCVFENVSIGDRYCQAGDWTTRTAFAARLISEKKNLVGDSARNGLLSCGADNEVLNSQVTQEFSTGCFYSNLEEAPRSRVFIVAVPLNSDEDSLERFITEEFAEIYSQTIDGNDFDAETCLNQLRNSEDELQKCDAGEVIISGKQMTIYYDQNHNIVYVSNDDSLSESTWDGFINFWRDLFNIGEEYESLSTDFDEVYLYRLNGNSVDAYTNTYFDNGAIVDHRNIKIDFVDQTKELQVANYARERDGEVVNQGTSTIITFEDKKSLWALLTTSSRYQLD